MELFSDFRILFIVGLACTLINAQSCRLNDFDVQQNFDLNKYLGKWYEIAWLPQVWIPPEEQYRDYQVTYTLKGDGDINVAIRARETKNSVCCLTYEASLETGNSPGKLLYDRSYNATANIKTDYWVVKTDYVNYALAYGCRERKSDGTCKEKSVDSWIWSRTTSLTSEQGRAINDTIKALCLNPESYFYTDLSNECTLTVKDPECGCSTATISVMLLLLTGLLWFT